MDKKINIYLDKGSMADYDLKLLEQRTIQILIEWGLTGRHWLLCFLLYILTL